MSSKSSFFYGITNFSVHNVLNFIAVFFRKYDFSKNFIPFWIQQLMKFDILYLFKNKRNCGISFTDLKIAKKSTESKKIKINGTIRNWVLYPMRWRLIWPNGQTNLFRSRNATINVWYDVSTKSFRSVIYFIWIECVSFYVRFAVFILDFPYYK